MGNMERKWPGYYIAVEGIDGCGGSTQTELLVRSLRERFPERRVISTREPGGCEVAEAVREALELEMEPVTEAHCFATARAQSLREIVQPALDRGAIVVSDRSVYSSLAYQGGGRELGRDFVREINKEAVGETLPDLVVLVNISVEDGLARKRSDSSDGRLNRLDQQPVGFYRRTRTTYLEMAGEEPDRWIIVDGMLPVDDVANEVWQQVLPRIQKAISGNQVCLPDRLPNLDTGSRVEKS